MTYPIQSIHDFRVPLPDSSREREDVPDTIYSRVRELRRERNNCTDARVEEIDTEILRLLAPWTEEQS